MRAPGDGGGGVGGGRQETVSRERFDAWHRRHEMAAAVYGTKWAGVGWTRGIQGSVWKGVVDTVANDEEGPVSLSTTVPGSFFT